MPKIQARLFWGLLCALSLFALCALSGFASKDPDLITDYTTLMTAVQEAKDGDVLLVGDIDFSPLSPDIPHSMMYIAIEKDLTIKSGKIDGKAVLSNGAFLLSGNKVAGEILTVHFENIVFDGKADWDGLLEADFAHPFSEAEQVETYPAAIKAQQALAFAGNTNASFRGCEFRNYMHDYGPVVDVRYADYTANEAVFLPDYSACKLNLYLENCRIEQNSARYDGGAVYIEANKNVVLAAKNCVFANNRSTNGELSRGGGAILAQGATVQLTDCTLESNIANYNFPDTDSPDYDTHKGGAILLENASLFMRNTTLIENRASLGGAVSFTNTDADIDGCRFLQNRAEAWAVNPKGMYGPWSNMSQGGAIYIEGNANDTVTLINCEIKDNSAAHAYGGICGYYVPFEDPSFPAYNIKMILCTFEGNNDDFDYDYSAVDDLLWMSHPGDMFTNPHLTLFGCYITDATFLTDFPRSDSPSRENGYNYLSGSGDAAMLAFSVPLDAVTAQIGNRYGDQLTSVHVGTNYDAALYAPPADQTEPLQTDPPQTVPPTTEPESSVSDTEPPARETDPSHPITTAPPADPTPSPSFPWLVWLAALIAVGCAIFTALSQRKKRQSPLPCDADIAAEPSLPEKQIIVKTRYDETEIERFLSLVPEVSTLTPRETEVLREVLCGKKQSEIAYRLGIEVSTVKDFNKKIYAKLKVDNRDGLLAKAAEVLRK